jgi:ribosome assembly protein YihI (activator of Der GTPase)
MKQLLARIIAYKLNPVNFNHFIKTFTEEVKTSPEVKKVYYQNDLNEWIQKLNVIGHDNTLSDEDHEIIDAILYRIEELLVHEIMFKPNRVSVNR